MSSEARLLVVAGGIWLLWVLWPVLVSVAWEATSSRWVRRMLARSLVVHWLVVVVGAWAYLVIDASWRALR